MKMDFPAVIHEYPTRKNLHLFGKVEFPGIALKVLRNIYMRNRLGESQNWRCCWCGVDCIAEPGQSHSATIEHVTPRSLGGQNHWDNYAMACAHCNHKRGTQSVEDFMAGKPQPCRKKKDSTRAERHLKRRLRKYTQKALVIKAEGCFRDGEPYDISEWLNDLALPNKYREQLRELIEQ